MLERFIVPAASNLWLWLLALLGLTLPSIINPPDPVVIIISLFLIGYGTVYFLGNTFPKLISNAWHANHPLFGKLVSCAMVIVLFYVGIEQIYHVYFPAA
jgi:hypothetical protein